ncbi:MAG: hypothetical protein KGD58_05785 [Candidatus Lokiarchaeota archaeon]|nr:hypothetical protein [Candidatus Lokiarchaeota archaeon]
MAASKRLYKTLLFSSILVGITCICCLYLFSLPLVLKAFAEYEGALQIVLIISARIIILSIISYYLFHKWFKQEAQYLSDIPFLLGLFFLILIFGKTIDLLWDLTFFTFNDDIVLIFLKFRFFIIIFEVAPLVYLGMEIIFFRLEDRFNKLKDKKYMNTLRTRLITIIVSIESIVVLIIPNVTLLGMVLPMMLIPSLLGIVYIFYLAYRLNRLSVVKPKILTIGFFVYLISNIFRPIMQSLLGENASYLIVVEFVDLIIFIVIFLGLYKKS